MTISVKHAHQTAIADDPAYDVGADEWNAAHTITGNINEREQLSADRTYYVNVGTGSDSNDGLTSGAAFATIQKAVDTVCDSIDLNAYKVTISVAAGTYPEEITLRDYVGGSTSLEPDGEAGYGNPHVSLVGAASTGSIISGLGSVVTSRLIKATCHTPWLIGHLEFSPGISGYDAVEVAQHAQLIVAGTITFNSGVSGDCFWVPGGRLTFQEATAIVFNGFTCYAFIECHSFGLARMWEHCTMSFSADTNFTTFVEAGYFGSIILGRLDSISLNTHTVTGLKWDTYSGGNLYTSTNAGGTTDPDSLLPGDTNGKADSGLVNLTGFCKALNVGSRHGVPDVGQIAFGDGNSANQPDTWLSRNAAANLRLGAADAAAPVAQTLSVQNVATGTSNTAGADFTISASRGTGSGAGGKIVLKTAAAGGSGTTQNSLANGFVLNADGSINWLQLSGSTDWVNRNVSGIDYLEMQSGGAFTFHAGGNGVAMRGLITGPNANGGFCFNNGAATAPDTFIQRAAAANVRLGSTDAASPVAQTLSVQNVVAGTSDTAGVDWTFKGSLGTGTGAGGKIIFQTAAAGSTGTSQNSAATQLTIDGPGNVVCGNAAISTSATDGFLYIPTCAGTPSGTPTTYTGRVAMVYDTTNHKLYIYDGGWKGGTAPGAWS